MSEQPDKQTYTLVPKNDPPIIGEIRYMRGDLIPAPWEPASAMWELPAYRVAWDGKQWVKA